MPSYDEYGLINVGQIKVIIEGAKQEGGHLRAGVFIDSLGSLMAGLYKSDKLISGAKTPSFFLRILELGTKSPATIVMEAVPYDAEKDSSSSALKKWFSVLRIIDQGKAQAESIEYDFLENFLVLTRHIGKYVSSINVSSNGDEFMIDNKFKARIDLFLAKEEKSYGFIQGMLEYINIHDRNVFKIYPDVGPTKLTCHFPESLREKAKAALGTYVEVRGELVFKSSARFPHEITVEEIDVFPPEETLMTFEEMQTVFAGFDGNK